MFDLPIAFAFSAGIVAAFNPCGFALLPVYLARFLAKSTQGRSRSLLTAAAVAAAVSAGFLLVFGVVGLVLSRITLALADFFPWLTVLVGLALMPVGIAMIWGYHPSISLPRLQKSGSGQGLGSMVQFGASYGTVSLSCTLPIFLAAVSATFVDTSVGAGLAVFAAYGLGMSLVLTALTLALALAKDSMVVQLKGVMPHVNRLSGILMTVAGVYVTYYGYYSIRVNRGEDVAAGPVGLVTDASAQVANWVNDFGAGRLGLVLVVFMLLVGAVSLTKAAIRRIARGVTSAPEPVPAPSVTNLDERV